MKAQGGPAVPAPGSRTPGAVLLECVLSGSLDPLEDPVVERAGGAAVFLEVARYHRLDHLLADLALSGPTLLALRDELSALRTARLMRQAALTADLAVLDGALRAAGLPWVVLKGPVTARRHYPRPAQRSYSDIDVLVVPSDFERALDVLVAAGASLLDRNWPLIHQLMCGELNLVLPFGSVLDLHWDLMSQAHDRRAFRIDSRSVVTGGVDLVIDGGTVVPAINPVDELLHLCLHAVVSGTSSLGRLRDVALAAAGDVDWEAVKGRAHSWRAGLVTAVALERASSTFSVHLDDRHLRDLAPSTAWRAAMRWSGRFFPATSTPPVTRRSSHLKLTRASGPASCTYLLSEVLGLALHPVHQRPRDAWDAGELQRPDGDSRALRAYFDAVSVSRSA